MAQSVTGASPVTFISEDTLTQNAGKQYQIPLPLISYDPTQTPPVILTAWPQSTAIAPGDLALAQTLIQTLINQGNLTLVTPT
ncbi:MAG TPA: hypothetical protein VKS60_19975 [Stellaceae bacterium]|nr:hypothetical protein [Stellaceae bacterium]